MKQYDFSNFRQSSTCTWLSDNLTSSDIATAPLGFRFWMLVAPQYASDGKWYICEMQKRMWPNILYGKIPTAPKEMIQYIDLRTIKLDYVPVSEWKPNH